MPSRGCDICQDKIQVAEMPEEIIYKYTRNGAVAKIQYNSPILHLCNKLYHNAINRDLDRFIYRNFIQAATKAGSELVIRVIKDDKIAGSST